MITLNKRASLADHDDGNIEYLEHPLLQHDEAVVGLASDQHQQRLWATCSKLQKMLSLDRNISTNNANYQDEKKLYHMEQGCLCGFPRPIHPRFTAVSKMKRANSELQYCKSTARLKARPVAARICISFSRSLKLCQVVPRNYI